MATYKNQLSADLDWIERTPSLFDHLGQTVSSFHPNSQQQLEASSKSPGIEISTTRVGRYFESLVQHLIQRQGYTIVEQNLQIQAEGRTIGELDFIFANASGVITHLETAIKFFLYDPSNTKQGSHYIGPNPNDTLQTKADRLYNHQLPLSKRFYSNATVRNAYVKGIIFYPPVTEPPSELPSKLNPHHARGSWLYASNLNYLESIPDAQFALCRKPHWLASPIDNKHYKNATLMKLKLQEHFNTKGHPVMVSCSTFTGNTPTELERIIVVPDEWPNF